MKKGEFQCGYTARSTLPFLQHLKRHNQVNSSEVRSQVHQEWTDQFFPMPNIDGASILGPSFLKKVFNGTYTPPNPASTSSTAPKKKKKKNSEPNDEEFIDYENEKQNIDEDNGEQSYDEKANEEEIYEDEDEEEILEEDEANELNNFMRESNFEMDPIVEEVKSYLNLGNFKL